MCRKGRMFAPSKTWRKWHRKVAVSTRRFAVVGGVAASATPALVEARGHRISNVPQIPLVVDNGIEKIKTTKKAVALLTALGAYADVQKCKDTRKIRPGVGKMRNRRHLLRKGPLVVFSKDDGISQAFRNIPGVDLCSVDSLNLLSLAPGGHVGRFIVWSEDAFKSLDNVFGTYNKESKQKHGYKLPHAVLGNADIARIINSDEIQAAVRPARQTVKLPRQKKNPLKNINVLVRLNPYAQTEKRAAVLANATHRKRLEAQNVKRGLVTKGKTAKPAAAKAAAKPAATKAAAKPAATKATKKA
jgi:large subunit ribosomal protein L4e